MRPMPSLYSTRKKFRTCTTDAGSWSACISIKSLHSTLLSTERCLVTCAIPVTPSSTSALLSSCHLTNQSDQVVRMVTSVYSLVTSVDSGANGYNKSNVVSKDIAALSTQTSTSSNSGSQSTSKPPKFRSKYRHVEALHKTSRPSVLSHDSEQAPSFLGFRNLMVLTISKSPSVQAQMYTQH